MDPNAGRFVDEDRAQKWMERVEVGEVVKIKGEELEIIEIGKRTLKLKLLSHNERMEKSFGGLVQDFDEMRHSEIERQRKKMLKHQK